MGARNMIGYGKESRPETIPVMACMEEPSKSFGENELGFHKAKGRAGIVLRRRGPAIGEGRVLGTGLTGTPLGEEVRHPAAAHPPDAAVARCPHPNGILREPVWHEYPPGPRGLEAVLAPAAAPAVGVADGGNPAVRPSRVVARGPEPVSGECGLGGRLQTAGGGV